MTANIIYQEQGIFTKANHVLEFNGLEKTLNQWGECLGIKPNTILCRIRRGWTIGESLEMEKRNSKALIGATKRKTKCAYCSAVFTPRQYQIKQGQGKYCSHKCHGADVRLDNGYVIIYVDGLKTKEHRHIMSKFIGRKLTNDEIVHHTNHNKTDNRISNLEIMTLGEHTTLHHLHRALLNEADRTHKLS